MLFGSGGCSPVRTALRSNRLAIEARRTDPGCAMDGVPVRAEDIGMSDHAAGDRE
jgi:hypothetical protein